jgi:hypothetical protein
MTTPPAEDSKAPDFIKQMLLSDSELQRLQKLYGVDLTPREGEKNYPFEILVARLAEKHQVSAVSIHASLRQAEPELLSFHLKQYGQIEHALPAAAKAKTIRDRNRVLHVFDVHARAFAAERGIPVATAHTLFARTEVGRWLRQQCD